MLRRRGKRDKRSEPEGPSRLSSLPARLKRGSTAVRTRTEHLLRTRRRRVVAAILLLVVLAGAAGGLWWAGERAAAAETARAEALEAARGDVVALLSYDFRTVEQSLPAAAENLTGPFHDDYTKLAQDVVIPAAKEQQTTTSTAVSRAGVISAGPDDVTALMFLNQTTTTGADPNPKLSGSRIRVELERVDGDWRISALTPL
ncbi:hypothetical protein Ae263Ps1_3481 [Pseudonocardia sp. Ae263_Ps1]|nr:hypothetical protein Ae263Ps1_3481 [Pseudonocardia sp. Ae263_Ps1]OLL93533.1 hypothetical protein Ae356Ps1_3430c [Pseudonocardia sp. Ae356_Ps1]